MMVVRPECCDKNEISYYSRTSAYKTSSGAGRGWVGGWECGGWGSIFGYLLWVPQDQETRAPASPAEASVGCSLILLSETQIPSPGSP